ncbi:hypothetical protein BJF79_02085 [Actinomadura sp. CNU-125]|nr:hypothetical protein BJF79_02085 [Actinomadura sp. CNU-125]
MAVGLDALAGPGRLVEDAEPRRMDERSGDEIPAEQVEVAFGARGVPEPFGVGVSRYFIDIEEELSGRIVLVAACDVVGHLSASFPARRFGALPCWFAACGSTMEPEVA